MVTKNNYFTFVVENPRLLLYPLPSRTSIPCDLISRSPELSNSGQDLLSRLVKGTNPVTRSNIKAPSTHFLLQPEDRELSPYLYRRIRIGGRVSSSLVNSVERGTGSGETF